ncbi:hypothetical protein [Streptomyces sp. N35]|uniref:hypothetical protein n=1 Tax=Streptomyces sp. N35 TaxID=2795730 RepID=UPI0018F3F7B2|nr:hypothetical protein [Streptomyces sp. N35]
MAAAVLLAALLQMAAMALLAGAANGTVIISPGMPALWLLITTVALVAGHLLLGVTTVRLARVLGGQGTLEQTPTVLALLAPLCSIPTLVAACFTAPTSTVGQVAHIGSLLVLALLLTRYVQYTQLLSPHRAFLACSLTLIVESELLHAGLRHATTPWQLLV